MLPKTTAKVSPLTNMYKELDKARRELDEFRADNERFFTKLGELNEALEVAQNKVKAALHTQFRGKDPGKYTEYSSDTVRVVVTAQRDRVLQVSDLLDAIPGLKGTTVIDIRLKELDKYVEEHPEFKEVVDRLTRFEPKTPLVQFVEPGPVEDKA